jgi:nicotinate phosphoribosyltransferase
MAAVDVARGAWIAGFEATSNVEAFDAFGIPARGTMAHMFIMAAEDEATAFAKYARIFPRSSYLVDTYDTLQGVQRALDVVGDDVTAVRLDSGDLATLTRQTRALLKERKREDVQIVVSSDLDEYEIERLIAEGDFDVAGVGTRLATSDDAPSLGGVYKLTQIDGRPVAKLAEGKVTYPGPHQVYRVERGGKMAHDWLGLTQEPSYDFIGTTPLLVETMRAGRAVGPFVAGGEETLAVMRARCRDGLAALPEDVRRIGPRTDKHERIYEVRPSPALVKLLDQVREDVRTDRRT